MLKIKAFVISEFSVFLWSCIVYFSRKFKIQVLSGFRYKIQSGKLFFSNCGRLQVIHDKIGFAIETTFHYFDTFWCLKSFSSKGAGETVLSSVVYWFLDICVCQISSFDIHILTNLLLNSYCTFIKQFFHKVHIYIVWLLWLTYFAYLTSEKIAIQNIPLFLVRPEGIGQIKKQNLFVPLHSQGYTICSLTRKPLHLLHIFR